MANEQEALIATCDTLAKSVGFATGEDFLNYCVTHSQTERALFSYQQIGALQVMGGYHETGNEWIEAWSNATAETRRSLFRSVDMSDVAQLVLSNLGRAKRGEELVPMPAG